jgi:phosphate transport system substrate-binding protein
MSNQKPNRKPGRWIAVVAIAVFVIIAGAFGYQVMISQGQAPQSSTTEVTSGSSTAPVGESVILNGAGSTLVFPLMSSWTFAYGQIQSNVRVNYASIGSGGGIAQITAKTVDFGASDAPLNAEQYAAFQGATILTIPESASAVVPAYNLPGIGNGLKFTGPVLARIFLGNITMWNDPAIAALNPGVDLPDHAITVVHRSDGSGTMYTFTDYLSDSSPQWKAQVGKGLSPRWPTGLGGKGNEGVAGIISNTQYSIGPLEIAYEIVNKGLISYGAVQNAAGNFILANVTNAAEALEAAAAKGFPAGSASWTDVSIVDSIFNDTAATGAYPITTFTYIFVYEQQTDQVKGTALANFLWWVVNSAQSGGTSLGYIPLPQQIVALDDATINSLTYNGQPIHTGT